MSVVECSELFRVHRSAEGDTAALQGLSLQLERGESLACLGPSGSGKTTLLRVLAGLEPPSAGRATVFGHDLGRSPARVRARIRRDLLGLVDQDPGRALPPDLTVRDAVALALTLRGWPPRAALRTADGHLERLGLHDRGAARPGELSGGERQRAALCAAVAHGPRLLLADEPTGELDARGARELLAQMLRLARDDGTTVLLVTHDPSAAGAADRSVHVRDGRISDEDRDGRSAVVVGRGGWLRIPEPLLLRAGIGERALVHADGDGVRLEAIAEHGRAAVAAPAHLPAGERHGIPAAVRGLRRVHGSRVVFDAVDVAWEPATFTVVTGRSGSGKSTLLRILAGLEAPDAGRALVGDVDVGSLDREGRARLRAERIAYVAQGAVLQPHLSVIAQTAPDPDRAAAWLELLGLGERATQRVGRLSGGERQRAAVARALASGRGLLLLDEPTSHLDQRNAASLGEVLAATVREHGRTVVCATHDPVLVAHADRRVDLGARA